MKPKNLPRPQSKDMGTPFGSKYMPYSYMDPLGTPKTVFGARKEGFPKGPRLPLMGPFKGSFKGI